MKHYERRLPHWDLVGQPLFVTFRLHNSLPANRAFPPERLIAGKAFVAMDRILDRASTGPRYLSRHDIAALMVKSLRDGDCRLPCYVLHSFAVMANHVHVLVTPHVMATQLVGAVEGFTAHEANRILGRRGRHFWQDESYDHVARSDAEFDRIRAYIESNPVTAGIVEAAEDFQWSSAWRDETAA